MGVELRLSWIRARKPSNMDTKETIAQIESMSCEERREVISTILRSIAAEEAAKILFETFDDSYVSFDCNKKGNITIRGVSTCDRCVTIELTRNDPKTFFTY